MTVTEGNTGTHDGDVHGHAVARQQPDGHGHYATANGTAVAPADYVAAAGDVVTFAAA